MCLKNYEKLFEDENDAYDYDYEDDDNINNDENNQWHNTGTGEDFENENDEISDDDDDDDDDDDLLKEQLDMHSMILSKCDFNGEDLDEPIITAEQVLDEIDSMMTMQVSESTCELKLNKTK